MGWLRVFFSFGVTEICAISSSVIRAFSAAAEVRNGLPAAARAGGGLLWARGSAGAPTRMSSGNTGTRPRISAISLIVPDVGISVFFC